MPNFRKIMQEVPRPLEVAARDARGEYPIGQRPISERKAMAQLEPLMGLLARGDVPLDETAARAVATYVGGFHKRVR